MVFSNRIFSSGCLKTSSLKLFSTAGTHEPLFQTRPSVGGGFRLLFYSLPKQQFSVKILYSSIQRSTWPSGTFFQPFPDARQNSAHKSSSEQREPSAFWRATVYLSSTRPFFTPESYAGTSSETSEDFRCECANPSQRLPLSS